MTPIEFIKERGWERSIELVEGCPDHCNFIVKCGYLVNETERSVCKIALKKFTDAYKDVYSYGCLETARKVAHKDPFESNPLRGSCYLVGQIEK